MNSMVATVTEAIKVAKANLGDLLIQTTMKRVTGRTYVNGVYTPVEAIVPVELVIDRFTYEEKQSGEYKETDVKASVFNNATGDLSISTDDRIVLDSILYSVLKVNPARVGPSIALFEVVLRR